jgi:hypothetical protein
MRGIGALKVSLMERAVRRLTSSTDKLVRSMAFLSYDAINLTGMYHAVQRSTTLSHNHR